jgi:tetrahydromethanopterin S-methyltransferase subunit G
MKKKVTIDTLARMTADQFDKVDERFNSIDKRFEAVHGELQIREDF